VAEREGFEPSTQFNPCNNLAGCRFRPLSHLSGFCDPTIAHCELSMKVPTQTYYMYAYTVQTKCGGPFLVELQRLKDSMQAV
jgi:hypothetical protein